MKIRANNIDMALDKLGVLDALQLERAHSMGHDLTPAVVEHILTHLLPHLQTADQQSQTP